MRASKVQKHLFGIREEYLVLALMAPIFLSCMLTDPILVSVENFNNGQEWVQLDYSSAPENQSFDFNISKFVARGNFSHDGVMRNFTLRICPVSGSPSNLRLYFPGTGESFLLKSGTLASCEDVEVNASGFDPYFNTTTATNLNLLWGVDTINNGGETGLNLMMLKNPRIYDISEPVTYTILLPGFVCDDARYMCFDGDAERSVTSPAKEWNGSLPIPGALLALLPPFSVPFPLNNTSGQVRMSLWDFPCPAYLGEGRYTAQITKAHIYVNNSYWVDTTSYMDDFTDPAFNGTAWDIRAENGSGLAYHSNNWTNSKLDLLSNDNTSGIIAYYDELLPFSSGEDNAVYVRVDFNHSEADNIGVFYLASNKTPPADPATISQYLYGGLLINGSNYSLSCNLTGGANMSGTFASENNTLEIFFDDFEANVMMYSVDGASLTNCSLPSEDLYFGFSPDPFVDSLEGSMSAGRLEVHTLKVHNTSGWKWMHLDSPLYEYYMNSTGSAVAFESDVIVRDCDDDWNCAYDFLLSSDTDGSINLSIVNITYENLIGYSGAMPSMDMDPEASFSWMGSNSTISGSQILYQSGIFDSRIEDSEVILSDLYCVNVTGSTIRSSVRIAEFDPDDVEEGAPVGAIRAEPNPCGVIENSELDGAFFLGGSIYDSRVASAGGIFMDLYGADFENYVLRDGRGVINITKYGEQLPAWLESAGLDNDSFDIENLGPSLPPGAPIPLGCLEPAELAIDGFPMERLSNMSAPLTCWFQLHNTHLVFSNISMENSTAGGPVLSLDNASFTIGNQSGDFNLRLRSENSYLQIWDVPAAATVVLNSSHLEVSDDVVAVDSAYYGSMEGMLATVRFGNAARFQNVYYYDGFTRDPAQILADGEICPPERCENLSVVGNAVVFNTTNFSSYAIQLAGDEDEDGGGQERLSLSIATSCDGNNVAVNGGGEPLEGAEVSVIHADTLSDVASGTTDSEGLFTFDGCGMEVRVHASMGGYLPQTKTSALMGCSECSEPPECVDDSDCEAGVCAEGECSEAEVPECALDSDCAEGYECEDGECVEEDEPEEECSGNSQCAENQICSGGSCEDLPGGSCGHFVDHAWHDYNCCDDSDCASGMQCEDHLCTDKQEEPGPEPFEGPPVVTVEPSSSQDSDIDKTGRGETGEACCMFGICATIFGMCWFHFILLALGFTMVLVALFALKPKKRRR